jgi:3-oxoacyl-[acyl-carrier protein] reductase
MGGTQVFDFKGKVALVTGASSGIGKATAAHFLRRGASVVMADIRADALDASGREFVAPERTRKITYDASNPADAEAAVRLCVENFGGLDYLIPAAGVYRDEMIAEMSVEQWRSTLAVNLDGIFFIIRSAIPAMREGGSIVNITSMAAHTGGSAGHGHYGAAKGGILSLTRTLARELGPAIRANAVSPGIIDTPMTQRLLADRGEDVRKQTPLRRFGRPEEIASVVAFLCSDAASFINGEAIHVNGGFYMGG